MDGHDGIGSQYPALRISHGNGFGLGLGQPGRIRTRFIRGNGAFVKIAGNDVDGDSGLLEQVLAAW